MPVKECSSVFTGKLWDAASSGIPDVFGRLRESLHLTSQFGRFMSQIRADFSVSQRHVLNLSHGDAASALYVTAFRSARWWINSQCEGSSSRPVRRHSYREHCHPAFRFTAAVERIFVSIKGSNFSHSSLLHFHVCVHCGSAFRREVFEGRSLTSGILLCPKCGLEGPLNVEILEAVEEQTDHQLSTPSPG